ncbi:MAG TPA: PD-(D/E)XK nuclease family protein [Candidatus Krumholzibacteria bacterium]|nr:PD-(D/E)XK nuclease family protein [Candidatus Krumholzibacteria bacterium]
MGRILTAAGAFAVEELLLAKVDEDQASVAADPALLRKPLRIVVPSRTLQAHLSWRICARRGGVAGLLVQTHLQLAFELFGTDPRNSTKTHDSLFALLLRREAEEHPLLREVLSELVQGTKAVVSSADDLCHAQISPELSEALLDALDEMERNEASLRARAVLESTFAAQSKFENLQLLSRDGLLARVSSSLRDRDTLRDCARGILIHGYADATGVVTGFLEELLHHPNSSAFLDRPADPAKRDVFDLGIEFSRPFGLRLGESLKLPEIGAVAPQLSAFCAPGASGEAREIARRLRSLLDEEDPPAPESVAIVARVLPVHFLDLTEALDDYGVPWRAPQAPGCVDAAGHKLVALLQLLHLDSAFPVDRWLELREYDENFLKLRIAAATLGAGRLRQLSSLTDGEIAAHSPALKLPIRDGLKLRATGESSPGDEDSLHLIGQKELRALRDDARALVQRLSSWPSRQSLPRHADTLRGLVLSCLDWTQTNGSAEALRRLENLLGSYDIPLELSRAEFLALLDERIEELIRVQEDGNGGGVQILDVTKARGLTFSRLFLIGLNRGAFPSSAKEDPLLPDRIRTRLRQVLPDLKSKRERGREERFLFAQLLSSAPQVTLSWWTSDDDGRPLPPSSFVQRLGLRMSEDSSPLVASEEESERVRPRPLREHLLQAALRDDEECFVRLLVPALAESDCAAILPSHPEAWAEATRAVLKEKDLWPGTAPDLGPWMEGPGASAGLWPDLQSDSAFVTKLEALARCPWAYFLEKVLRLQPLPDPLASLPLLDRRRVGSVVHKTLERIVERVIGKPPRAGLQAIVEQTAVEVPWPDDPLLARTSEDAALEVLREEGLALPGLARALATCARPYLEVCRQELFSPSPPKVVAAEVSGAVELAQPDGPTLRLLFRADMAQRRQEELHLIDFKSSAPFITTTKDASRRRHLLNALHSGTRLQGMSYALSLQQMTQETGWGSYLHLKPDASGLSSWIDFRGDDREASDALREVVKILHDARRRGSLFPRVVDPTGQKEPDACKYCEVSAACVRGDSQSRQREAEFFLKLRARQAENEKLTEQQELLLALWELPGAKS